jgi:hypothetical protein
MRARDAVSSARVSALEMPPALFGLGGAQAGLAREDVGQQRNGQKHDDGDRILAVRRHKGAGGLQVKVDVDQGACQRRRYRETKSPSRRDHQHPEQEQRAEGIARRDLSQLMHEQRLGGDQRRGHHNPNPQGWCRRPHNERKQPAAQRPPTTFDVRRLCGATLVTHLVHFNTQRVGIHCVCQATPRWRP